MSWHEQQLKIIVGLVPHRFRAQANVVAFYIGFNVFSKAWPIVFLTNQLSCFIDIEMTYQRVVMVSADDFGLNNFRHKR